MKNSEHKSLEDVFGPVVASYSRAQAIEDGVLIKDGHSTEAGEVSLKLMVGPGDAGEPVVTIMLPSED